MYSDQKLYSLQIDMKNDVSLFRAAGCSSGERERGASPKGMNAALRSKNVSIRSDPVFSDRTLDKRPPKKKWGER